MGLRLKQKRIVVPTAGTPVQFFTSSTPTTGALIIADPSNTGPIWIGDASVNASNGLGTPLSANENVELDGSLYEGVTENVDLSQQYVDVENDGDAIIIAYYEREVGESYLPFPNIASLSFDGVNENVNFGNVYDVTDTSLPISFSFWLKPDDFAAERAFLSKHSNDANVYGYIFYIRNDGTIKIQYRSPSQLRQILYSSSLTAAAWNHVVITYNGSQNTSGLRVYINGVIDPTVPAVNVITNAPTNTGDFILGSRPTGWFFKGNMQNVSIWNKTLSQAEISELYGSGAPLNLNDHSAASYLLSWWRLNTSENFPVEVDTIGSYDGDLQNMIATNYEADVPS